MNPVQLSAAVRSVLHRVPSHLPGPCQPYHAKKEAPPSSTVTAVRKAPQNVQVPRSLSQTLRASSGRTPSQWRQLGQATPPVVQVAAPRGRPAHRQRSCTTILCGSPLAPRQRTPIHVSSVQEQVAARYGAPRLRGVGPGNRSATLGAQLRRTTSPVVRCRSTRARPH